MKKEDEKSPNEHSKLDPNDYTISVSGCLSKNNESSDSDEFKENTNRDHKSSDISNNSSSFEDKKSSLKTESSKIEKGKSLYSASNDEDDLEEVNKKIEKYKKKYEFWISKRKFLEKKRNAKFKSEKSEEN